MEEKIEVKVVSIDYRCPQCKTGFLRPSGAVLASNPPIYPHSCNLDGCDYGESIRGKAYPYIGYEPIEQ